MSNRRTRSREIRFHVVLALTKAEIRQLQAAASADLRSISNYVSQLIIQDLRQARRKRRGSLGKPADRRAEYDVAVRLTRNDREKLRERAESEVRSLGNYVTTVVVRHLRRRKPT